MRIVALALAVVAVVIGASASAQVQVPQTRLNAPLVRYSNLPLAFEPNVGQTDRAVKYVSRGARYSLFLTETEAVLSLTAKDADAKPDRRTNLRMHFAGGNPKAKLEPCDQLPSKSNFFIGNDPAQWRANVPNYARVQYRDVYPGVDVIFYGNQRQLEYDLVLSPGADPGAIRLRFDGVERIETEKDGDLILVSSAGTILQRKPVVYQRDGEGRREIESRYAVRGNQVAFQVAKYDTREPLVIDPIVVLRYAEFLGGSDLDQATSIATDGNGNAYVAGFTQSTNFATFNGIFMTKALVLDAFVAKLDSAGALVYSTYLGGNALDQASAVATDASGNVYVTGSTSSTNFPLMNALQSSLTGATNAFVAKINSAGNALTYSTYLGGIKNDQGTGIAADASGNAYIAGFTSSQDFPHATAQQTPIQASNGGPLGTFDAWVAKIDATGAHLVYATYLGGMSNDQGTGIAVDTATNVYVTGWTMSSDFPHQNGIQTTLAGSTNAFVTKINAAGTAIVYSTYLGGSVVDEATGIAVDAVNPPNVYVIGFTQSSNFPHTNGLFMTLNRTEDAFVSKINPTGTAFVYSTFLGGSMGDLATGIAADASGNAYVVGNTSSTDFPHPNALQGTFGGGGLDAFVSKFSSDGQTLLFSSFLGGTGSDQAGGIAVDGNGNVFVAGGTSSADFFSPNMSNGYGGAGDAFVLVLGQMLSISKTHTGNFTQGQQNATYTVKVTNGGSMPTSGTVTVTETLPGGLTAVSIDGGLTWSCTQPSGPCTRSDALLSGSSYPSITVTVNVASNAASPQINQVSVSGGGAPTASANDETLIIAPGPAQAVSVSPNSGSGSAQTFTFTFSDAIGATHIVSTAIDIGAALSQSGSCYVYFNRGSNLLFLADDAGIFHTGLTPGVAGTAANSQCMLDAGASSVMLSGNTLTENLALSFKPAYAGAKSIFMEVFNGFDSGFVLRGTWTAMGSFQPDFTISMTPGTQSVVKGGPASYTVTVTALNGFSGVVSFGASGLPSGATSGFMPTTVTGSGSTTLTINTSSGGGVGNFNIMVTGTSGALNHNTSASLTVTNTSPPTAVSVTPNSGSGSSQTFAFLFSDPAGATNIISATIDVGGMLSQSGSCYVYFARGSNLLFLADDAGIFHTGLTPGVAGTASNSQCMLDAGASSVMPSGNNLTLNLALSFKPPYAGAKSVFMEVFNGLDSGWVLRGTWTATVSVQPDFTISMTPGTQSVVKGGSTNYTVTITALNGFGGVVSFAAAGLPSGATSGFLPTTVTGSGSTTLTVNTSSGGGVGNFTVMVTGTSGMLNHNTSASLTVTNTSPPTNVSVTPNSGSGASQTFAFLFSDPAGATNIVSTTIDIGPVLSQSGSCYVYFARGSNLLFLADDAGIFHAGLTPGVAGTATNSQCTMDAGASSVVPSGNNLTLNLALSFKPAFGGLKKIFMEAFNGLDSGFVQNGTFTSP